MQVAAGASTAQISLGRASSLTIVVPTLNEAVNVLPLLNSIAEAAPGARVLLADDDSRDGTRDAARMYRGALNVEVLHRRNPLDRGLTASVADAILQVETPYVVVMDADLQHPATTLPRLLDALESGSHLAVATRVSDEAFSLPRRIVSRGGRVIARTYLRKHKGLVVDDPMSGFFALRTDVAQRIVREHGDTFERGGFKILVDLLLHAPADLQVRQVEYGFQARHAGWSKLTTRHYLSLLRQLGPMGRAAAVTLDLVLTGIIFRFLAVGASGVLVNAFALFALHEGFALPLLAATPLAIEFSVLWNFAWNESWTFRGRGHDSVWRRLRRFHLASVVGMGITFAVVAGGTLLYPGVWYQWLNLIGIAIGSAANLLINLNWTWGVPVEEIEDRLPE